MDEQPAIDEQPTVDEQPPVPPRRLIDARFDYNKDRGVSSEAERFIVLRLVGGVPRNYLHMVASSWRQDSARDGPVDGDAQFWYETVRDTLKNDDQMKQLKLKADFFREQWNLLPVLERLGRSRDDWVSSQLDKYFHEERKPADWGPPTVTKALAEEYTAFERREAWEDQFRKAAQLTYFELTQPEAAAFLRKQAAEEKEREATAAAEPPTMLEEQGLMQLDENYQERQPAQIPEDVYRWLESESEKPKKDKKPIVWDWQREEVESLVGKTAAEVEPMKRAHDEQLKMVLQGLEARIAENNRHLEEEAVALGLVSHVENRDVKPFNAKPLGEAWVRMLANRSRDTGKKNIIVGNVDMKDLDLSGAITPVEAEAMMAAQKPAKGKLLNPEEGSVGERPEKKAGKADTDAEPAAETVKASLTPAQHEWIDALCAAQMGMDGTEDPEFKD